MRRLGWILVLAVGLSPMAFLACSDEPSPKGEWMDQYVKPTPEPPKPTPDTDADADADTDDAGDAHSDADAGDAADADAG